MIADDERGDPKPASHPCVALCVGNSQAQVAIVQDADAREVESLAVERADAIVRAVAERAGALAGAGGPCDIVLATVNEPASTRLARAIAASRVGALAHARLVQLGVDLPIPIRHTLGPAHTTGQDRFLAALGAFHALEQACVVVDAGTALTVDFVDGEGVFHGGAIAPGLAMGLDALHARTAALPSVKADKPDDSVVFPKTTASAMRTGVWFAAIGLVRTLTERYAERFGAYPKVIATGGDAAALFGDDPLVDRVEPFLVLSGVGVSFAAASAGASGKAPLRPSDDDAEPHAGLSAL